jgi:hypothetical protein
MTGSNTVDTRRVTLTGLGLGAIAALVAILPNGTAKFSILVAVILAPCAYWVIAGPVRWIPVFIATAWLLPPLPIEIGNSGPHLAVVIAAAGLLAGLLRLTDWRFDPDWLTGSMLVLFAVFAAGLPFAFAYSGLLIGIGSTARLCLLGIAVYGFHYMRYGPARLHDDFARTVVLCILFIGALSALLACIDFYYQLPAPAGYGPQFIWLDSGVFRRAQGMFYEASTLGNLCAFVLEMIVAALVLRPRELRIPAWSLALAGLPLGVALVLSYSRASMINVLIATTVLLWLVRRRIHLFRTAVFSAVVLAIGAAVLSWFFPTFFDAYLLRAFASLQYFGEAPNAVLSGRLQTWSQLAAYITEHPVQVLLGIGYKTLPYSNVTGTTAIADNTYLSTVIENGIAGLLALLTFNGAVLFTCYKAFRAGDSVRSFLGAWFLCFWSGQIVQMMSADLLTYWRLLPAYFCVLALATRNPAAEAVA